jgi:hypothetical protein
MFNTLGIYSNQPPIGTHPINGSRTGGSAFVENITNNIGGGFSSGGIQGATGYTGSFGYTGSQGAQGPSNGYTGSVGYTGSIGYTGSQGNPGGLIIPVTDVATSTYTALSTDYFLCVLTIGIVTITFPTGVVGTVYIVKDCFGDAANNPITIQGTGGQLVDGSTATINTNFGSLQFVFNGVDWSIV